MTTIITYNLELAKLKIKHTKMILNKIIFMVQVFDENKFFFHTLMSPKSPVHSQPLLEHFTFVANIILSIIATGTT